MNQELLLLLFSLATALGLGAVTLRRCYRDTSAGHFHKRLSSWGLPEGFDEAEKLNRIGVVLDLLAHLTRAAWFGLWIVLRVQPYYVDQASSLLSEALARPLTAMGELEPIPAVFYLQVTAELIVMSVLVYGLIPQVVSSFRGKRIALGTLPVVYRVESVLWPMTRSFRALRRALLRLVGNGKERTGAERAEEGIRAAVEIGEREGVLHDREKNMIESLLEFHDAEVTEVMTPRTEMVCMEASVSIEEAIPQAIGCGHSRIPVFRENIDEMVGVLYVKDLLKYARESSSRGLSLGEVVRKVYFVPETKKISALLAEFRSQRFHIAVILDEYGGTAGLVTIEDILEEIVGEIEDEYDVDPGHMIQRIDETTFEIDGRAHIDDVNQAVGIEIPESDDYETIAGFIFGEVGKVPAVNDTVEHQNLQFQITRADNRKIELLRLRILHPQEHESEA